MNRLITLMLHCSWMAIHSTVLKSSFKKGFGGEHITDIYITETGTTELENLSHNIIDIFIIET